MTMTLADEHTLEDLELLDQATRRQRMEHAMLLASGVACGSTGGKAWERWYRDVRSAIRELLARRSP
jgi:hypothetical protein